MRWLALVVFAAIAYLAYAVDEDRPRAPGLRPRAEERTTDLKTAVSPCRTIVVYEPVPAAAPDPDPDPDPVAVAAPVPDPASVPDPVPVRTGSLEGTVTEAATGDPLPGATIVVSSPTTLTQTVITDEHGYYKVIDLPPATYLVTFFYSDRTVERAGIGVGTLDPARLDLAFDLSPPTRDEVGVSFSGNDTYENHYYLDQ